MLVQVLAFISCSDDDDNSGWPTDTDKTEIFIERFHYIGYQPDFIEGWSTYGELKDNYPVSSKSNAG